MDYLKKPNLTKNIEHQKCKGFSLTTCDMQGWRRTMQDAQIYHQLQKDVHLFGVFDGHGGAQVAQYAAKMLPKQLLNEPYFKLKNYSRALVNVFKRIDDLIASERGQKDLRVINQEVKGMQLYGGQKIGQRAGTTAVVLLMTNDKFLVANIGDSRAVLCRNGQVVPLSTDHKPQLPSQHNRIQKAGGFVQEGRVNGVLSLSRSFGDFQHKRNQKLGYQQQCVTCLPQIVQIDRSFQDDQFILLGCDGVWQRYVSNSKKMVETISSLLQKHENSKIAIDKLFSSIVAKDIKDSMGYDNMTAQLIEFQK